MATEDAVSVNYIEGCLCSIHPMPELPDDATVDQIRRRNKRDNDDFICRGHILNGMSDALFDVYQSVETTKELWDSLESKYMVEDALSKKFLVSNFNNYKMVDSRPVMEQFHEILRILGQFTQHNLKMDESISVSSIIDKLPPSWQTFKHMLKHKKEELSLTELGGTQHIEESILVQEGGKTKEKNVASSSVNMIEDSKRGNKNNKRFIGKKRKFQGKHDGFNKKDKKSCWICGKPDHFKKECRVGKNKDRVSGSGSRNGSKDQVPNQG
ncbi:uncharacterized protein [Rutidosis leptorrhynchoides]|uniref:uncharacterized protein n=1 Tax=Rutidosis leptorrhynchoides TaxID=125765 RepID=UPI003A99A928